MSMIHLKYQKIRARVHFKVFMIDIISTDSAAWSASFHAIEAPAGKSFVFIDVTGRSNCSYQSQSNLGHLVNF